MRREICQIVVEGDDLARLAPGELAEWDQVWASDPGVLVLGDWLTAHGVPFWVFQASELATEMPWYGWGPA